MQDKKQQLELNMEQQSVSKLGKEYVKAVYCHCDYLTSMQCTSCEMLGWMKFKLKSRLLGEILTASDTQRITTLTAESEVKLKNLVMKVKEESAKAGLKLIIQKTKIMLSIPITSWQIDGKKVKTGTYFIFLGSKITADGDCSHEIKKVCSLEEKL